MFRATLTVAAILSTLVTPASATWLTNKTSSDFEDILQYSAITANANFTHFFGVRCNGQGIEIVFVTPDKSFETADSLETVNSTDPKIRIRIDKGNVHSLDAKISNTDKGARAIAETDLEFLNQIKGAKSSISVVLTILDQNFHETRLRIQIK
ncbi:hypothetical protein [Pseudochelatococcus sp. G4_1912]|uniref:hypothetical protein n=1 Tax=Pseudochelatococcus sp. G4_1912 TaxID=3114288 RepID=UPI0039C6A04F